MWGKLDIKERNFHGMLVIGGIAGIIEGTLREGFTIRTMFPGMMLTLVAAFLGGFTGFFLKDLFRTLRGRQPYRGVNNDGWLMGSFMGAFIGTLFQLMNSASGANLVVGSMCGAYFGAMFGAFPDEFITPILELMRSDQRLRAESEKSSLQESTSQN